MIKRIAVLALAFAFCLAAFNMQPVFAAAGDTATLTGVILSIDEVNSSFQVETIEGVVYTIHPGLDFDYSSIVVGDEISLNGTEGEDGSIVLTDFTEVVDEEGKAQGFYCMQSVVQHPAALKLSKRFDVDYATIQSMFCDGAGIGQIMLAFETAQNSDGDAADLLAQREAGAGWGQIWNDLGLHGNPHDNESELSSDSTDLSATTPQNDRVKENHGKPEKSKKGRP